MSSTADAGISNRPVERSTLAAASFSRPDSLSFRIQGADTAWAVGGGRYGVRYAGCDAYWLSQDTLYPADPDAGVKTSRHAGTWGREPDGTVRIGDFSVAIQGTSVIPYP